MAEDNSLSVFLIWSWWVSRDVLHIVQMNYCEQEESTQAAGITCLVISQGLEKVQER